MNFKNLDSSNSYFDISPTINSEIAVYPMDVNFKRNTSHSFVKGDHLELSSITTTLHLGAHADAPSHYHQDGQSIEQRNLKYYLGDCQVVQLKALNKDHIIRPHHLDGVHFKAPRILFATNSFKPNQWSDNFASFCSESIDFLAQKNIITIGIDTPSVDTATSKDLLSHQSLFKHDMAILEGLVLDAVPEGVYQLVALPLKLEACEASPVRAILIK